MNNEERDRVLETVRKLAAMADPENGAFPQEIATASAKMQILMDQYSISMSEVLFEEENSNGRHQEFNSATSNGLIGSLRRWHWQLARCIARITGTRHHASTGYGRTMCSTLRKEDVRGHHMSFFGLPQTCQLAADLFDEWVVLIDQMGRQATSQYVKEMTILCADEMEFQGVKQFRHLRDLGEDHPDVWRNSWLEGVTAGIMSSLVEQEKTRAAETTTALMVISTALMAAYKEYSRGFVGMGGGSSGRNSAAYDQGHAVGRTIRMGSKRLA
jgi:hypothetical protein